MKITTKFIFSTVLIVFITGAILVGFSVNTQKRLIEEQIIKKGSVLAEVLSVSLMIPMLNFDYSSVKLFFDTLSRDTDVIEGELLDNNNIVKMHTDIDRLGESHIYKINFEDMGDTIVHRNDPGDNGSRLISYDFFSSVRVEDEQIGVFHITLTNETYLQVIRIAWIKMMLLGLFVIVIGIAGAFLLGVQISRPIKELVKGAESVSGGNFNWDVNIRSRDEIGILSTAFKNMTERLDINIKSRINSEKMAVIGQLSSVLAHEIKNPLEPIKGSAELLKIYYPEEEQILKFAGIIQEEVLRLISFIDNFLDFARPRDPEFKEVNLNTLINKTFLLLEKLVHDNKIDVEFSLEGELPPVRGDASMLKQVVLNVVLNAIQAVKKNHGYIKVVTSHNGSMAELKITDHGTGIEKEVLDSIFDPFYTTKAEGSGTGLTTSLRIIEQHGGEIIIESEPGMMTMVQILLPLIVARK